MKQIFSIVQYLHKRNYIIRNLSVDKFIVTFPKSSINIIKETYKVTNLCNMQSITSLLANSYKSKINQIDKFKNSIRLLDEDNILGNAKGFLFPDLFYYSNQFIVSSEEYEKLFMHSNIQLIDIDEIKLLNELGETNSIIFQRSVTSPEMLELLCKKEFEFITSYDITLDSWHLGNILFYFQELYYPFNYSNLNDKKNDLIKMIQQGDYIIELNENLSYEYIDFLLRTLISEPQYRFDSNMLEKHAFLYMPIDKHHKILKEDILEKFIITKDNKKYIGLNINQIINVNEIKKQSNNFINDFEINSEKFIQNSTKIENITVESRFYLNKLTEYCVVPKARSPSNVDSNFINIIKK